MSLNEEHVEERLVGLEEPLNDEVDAIKEYVKAKEKGSVKLIPLPTPIDTTKFSHSIKIIAKKQGYHPKA